MRPHVTLDFIYPGLVKAEISLLSEPRVLPSELEVNNSANRLSTENLFLAGRSCAKTALETLLKAPQSILERGESGEPLWPEGTVGSISHSKKLCAAVVGRSSHFLSVGFDTELWLSSERAHRVQKKIVNAQEHEILSQWPEDFSKNLTLIFSAKESIFKALFPIVKRKFWFHSAELVKLDFSANKITFRLTETLTSKFEKNSLYVVDALSDSAGAQTLLALPQ